MEAGGSLLSPGVCESLNPKYSMLSVTSAPLRMSPLPDVEDRHKTHRVGAGGLGGIWVPQGLLSMVLFKGTVYCLSSPTHYKSYAYCRKFQNRWEKEWSIFPSECLCRTLASPRSTKNFAFKDLPCVFRLRLKRDIFISY